RRPIGAEEYAVDDDSPIPRNVLGADHDRIVIHGAADDEGQALHLDGDDTHGLAVSDAIAAVLVARRHAYQIGTGRREYVRGLLARRAADRARRAITPVERECKTGGLIDARGIGGIDREGSRLAANAARRPADTRDGRPIVHGDHQTIRALPTMA